LRNANHIVMIRSVPRLQVVSLVVCAANAGSALDELHTSWIILQASSPRELLQALPWHCIQANGSFGFLFWITSFVMRSTLTTGPKFRDHF
jgi:hypothetical protein